MPFSFGIDIVIGNGTLICQKKKRFPFCLSTMRAVVRAGQRGPETVPSLAALESAEHLILVGSVPRPPATFSKDDVSARSKPN